MAVYILHTSVFITYSEYGWIEEWFKYGMQETPEEMAELLEKSKAIGEIN